MVEVVSSLKVVLWVLAWDLVNNTPGFVSVFVLGQCSVNISVDTDVGDMIFRTVSIRGLHGSSSSKTEFLIEEGGGDAGDAALCGGEDTFFCGAAIMLL